MKNEENKADRMNGYQKIKHENVSWYRVQLHNNDVTPMGFVVGLLEQFFDMDRRCATTVMLEAHTKGQSTCGVYTKDIAASKIAQVESYARRFDCPIIFSMEADR